MAGILANTKDSLPSLPDKCLAVCHHHIDDPEWSVQEAALSFINVFRSEKSIPVLIETLDKIKVDPQGYRERIKIN